MGKVDFCGTWRRAQTHREDEGGGEDVRDGHVVGGESAGLVGADDVRAAQGLDGGQLAHHGVPLGHPHHAEGQGHRHHDGQALNSVARCQFPKITERFFWSVAGF